MAEGMNKVILLGHLGQDPELRHLPSGTPILNLRVATNETYVDKNKEPQERVEWHSVVVWGARGEALSRILVKGSMVLIEGNLRTSSYEKDGVKRYRTEVVAREVCLAGRKMPAESALADVAMPVGPGPAKTSPVGARPRAMAVGAELIDELPY